MNCTSDASLFVYHRDSVIIYFLVYVDDLIVTGSSYSALAAFLAAISHRFSFQDLGDLHYFLGVEVVPTASGLFLSQHKYVCDLLEKFSMTAPKPTYTPMSSSIQLRLKDGSQPADATLYRELVDSLFPSS